MSVQDSNTGRRRRRWLSFNLRTLLVFVTVAAIVIAWIARERSDSRRQLESAARLSVRRTNINYMDGWGSPIIYDLDQVGWRQRLTDVFGIRVERVSLNCEDVADISRLADFTNLESLQLGYATGRDLSPLAKLTTLRRLKLMNSGRIDLSIVAGLHQLEELALYNSTIEDLTPLMKLSNLRELDLYNTKVSDLSPLFVLRNLTWLDIRRTRATEEQIQELRKRLPNCRIVK